MSPKRNCCKSLRSTMQRLGSKEDFELDEEGQVIDDDKWDFKATLERLEHKIKVNEVKPIYNFDAEIREYINRSFLERKTVL